MRGRALREGCRRMPTQVSQISAQLSPLLQIFLLSLAEGLKP